MDPVYFVKLSDECSGPVEHEPFQLQGGDDLSLHPGAGKVGGTETKYAGINDDMLFYICIYICYIGLYLCLYMFYCSISVYTCSSGLYMCLYMFYWSISVSICSSGLYLCLYMFY